ncbi:MAG: type II secretion system major pseudopilin GspG [Gammaproteobacteria bacterium]|nr:type II secretion system major pseudopilin GspG [Gammaproteobacteria bacterium]
MTRWRMMEVITVTGNRKAGFTLVELLIVLLIVSLLAALVGPTLYQKINPAKESAAKAQIQNFSTALDSFLVDVGRYPTNREGLESLFYRPDGLQGWNGPYVKKEIPNDPWNHPYVYQRPGRNGPYEILSYGADGVEGGEDENRDITNWESR